MTQVIKNNLGVSISLISVLMLCLGFLGNMTLVKSLGQVDLNSEFRVAATRDMQHIIARLETAEDAIEAIPEIDKNMALLASRMDYWGELLKRTIDQYEWVTEE